MENREIPHPGTLDSYDTAAEEMTGIDPANATRPEQVALAGIAQALEEGGNFGKFAKYVQSHDD